MGTIEVAPEKRAQVLPLLMAYQARCLKLARTIQEYSSSAREIGPGTPGDKIFDTCAETVTP